MAAKKRKQKQTLKEFRAWLMGVEELQPEGWSPNRDQWKLIRARIDGIIEEKKVVEKVEQRVTPINNPIYQQGAPITGTQGPVQSLVSPAPVSGGVPAGDVEMTAEARKMFAPAPGEKAKTPHIDTSDGTVKSSFA